MFFHQFYKTISFLNCLKSLLVGNVFMKSSVIIINYRIDYYYSIINSYYNNFYQEIFK